jgi:hypothetical protein
MMIPQLEEVMTENEILRNLLGMEDVQTRENRY